MNRCYIYQCTTQHLLKKMSKFSHKMNEMASNFRHGTSHNSEQNASCMTDDTYRLL